MFLAVKRPFEILVRILLSSSWILTRHFLTPLIFLFIIPSHEIQWSFFNEFFKIGIEAVEPLWEKNPEEVLSGFIDSGFEALIVSAQSKFIGQEWLGRRVDRKFLNYLKRKDIDICGENGEYHTLVVDGPIFRRRIEIIQSRTIKRENHWFLDTCRYRLV